MSSLPPAHQDSISLKWGRIHVAINGRLALVTVIVLGFIGPAALWLRPI
jgi:hypothetical protein